MVKWSVNNTTFYQEDPQEVMAVHNNMGNRVTSITRIIMFNLEVADALELAENYLDIAGKLIPL